MPTSSAMIMMMLGFLAGVCADATLPNASGTATIAVVRNLFVIITLSSFGASRQWLHWSCSSRVSWLHRKNPFFTPQERDGTPGGHHKVKGDRRPQQDAVQIMAEAGESEQTGDRHVVK